MTDVREESALHQQVPVVAPRISPPDEGPKPPMLAPDLVIALDVKSPPDEGPKPPRR